MFVLPFAGALGICKPNSLRISRASSHPLKLRFQRLHSAPSASPAGPGHVTELRSALNDVTINRHLPTHEPYLGSKIILNTQKIVIKLTWSNKILTKYCILLLGLEKHLLYVKNIFNCEIKCILKLNL